MTCPDPNQIAAFLEGHLTSQEVESFERHLDACSECRRMVAFGGSSSSSQQPKTLSDRPSPPTVPSTGLHSALSPGDRLDNFIVLKWLGAGGMGEVFLAKDADLGRSVAVKVIRRDRMGSSQEVDRFMREARVTARLNHPGIVTIYAVGNLDGAPYLALEYIEGETLQVRLHAGHLAPRAWIPIAKSVAEAAREAHRHLIVHGDLKPSNVLLGKDGRVRTFDFGLARFVRSSEGTGPSMTIKVGAMSVTGVQGTPGYMAPEQWDAHPATPASDVWALGILMFEMAVGHVPFSVARVARRETDAASACDAARAVGKEIPAVVEDLIVRCLDVNPEQRPAMTHVVDALGVLERVLELPSLDSKELPWGTSSPRVGSPSVREAESGPGTTFRTLRESFVSRWMMLLLGGVGALGLVLVIVVFGAKAAVGGWALGSWSEPSTSDPLLDEGSWDVLDSGMLAVDSMEGGDGSNGVAEELLREEGRGASVPAALPSPPATSATSPTVASSRPPKPPLPSMRLAALAHLEDRAEEADQKAAKATSPAVAANHRSLARQMRGMADKQIDDVERIATQMQAAEPANAASLLDYVHSARAYLRQRRAAAGVP